MEPFYTDCGKVNCQRHSAEVYCVSPKNLRNKATEHTELPLMGIYLGKIKPRQDTGTATLSAGLFTRA